MPRDDDGSPDSIDAYDRIVFHWPYPYDLLVWALTFGRERAPREGLADLARFVPGESALDVGCGTGSLAVAATSEAACVPVCQTTSRGREPRRERPRRRRMPMLAMLSQKRVERAAQAGAARAGLYGVGHALLIRGHCLRR